MRPALLSAGLVTLAFAWLGPPSRSFASHMTAHMMIVALASPLIAIGLAGSRVDPVRTAPAWFVAIPASLVELVVVWAWHAPVLHDGARLHPEVFVAEQASFLAAGLFLWCSVLGGDAEERIRRSGSSIIALVLTFAHMTLLGTLLALTPRPLYRHAAAHVSVTALADQQLGGTIMLVVGGIAYIGGGLWLSHGLLRRARPQVGPA